MSTLTRTRRMRTNAGQVILTSTNERRVKVQGSSYRVTNVILDYSRDNFSGSMTDWALDVLWATQVFRMAWDSPRIGGGIDPAVATNVSSIETERHEGGLVGYIVGGEDEDDFDPSKYGGFDGLTNDEIQDMIVHAEAVALLTLAVYGRDG